MDALGLFFSYPGQVIKRYLARERFTRVVTLSIFIIVMLFVAAAIYAMTFGGLIFISDKNNFVEGFYFYIIQLFGIVVFALGLMNSVLVLASSFAKKNHQWIITTPSFPLLAFMHLSQLLLSSIWIFLAIITPVLLAIANFQAISLFQFLLSFILMTILIILANIVGTFLYLICVYILQGLSSLLKKNIVSQSRTIVMLLGVTLLSAWGIWSVVIPADFVSFFNTTGGNIDTIRENLMALPTFGISQILYNVLFEGNSFGTIFTLAFVILITIGLILLHALLRIQYLRIWQLMQEGNYVAHTKEVTTEMKSYGFPGSGILSTVIDKELLLIWRDKKNMLWLLIVIILWGAQTLVSWYAMNNGADYGPIENIPSFVYPLIMAIGLYFMSALTLRFVFPTFSAERKVGWILGTAPISLWEIVIGKLFVYSVLFILLGSPLLILNLFIVSLSINSIIIYVIMFAITVITIILFAIYLSVQFPNRFTSDPETLSTTLPGLIFTSVALASTILIASIANIGFSDTNILLSLILFLTGICMMLTIRTYKAVQSFEYSGEIIA